MLCSVYRRTIGLLFGAKQLDVDICQRQLTLERNDAHNDCGDDDERGSALPIRVWMLNFLLLRINVWHIFDRDM